jgi:hypothetical protein
MTNEERQQSLINARIAYEWLTRAAPAFDQAPREQVECLLAEFRRLDDKEQKQIKEGKRGGKLGGRPKGSKKGKK